MSEARLTEIIETSGADYGMRIAKWLNPNARPFLLIGYNPSFTTTEEDIWTGGAGYVFPTAAAQWRIAAGNAADAGTVIKGNAEGANQTVLCDVGGTTTLLIDASVDFSAATAVAVGDIILLDPKGTTPEFGYVTSVADAATGRLVIAGGFSEGGSCATARAYTIVDKSATTGVQVVKIDYLTDTFAKKRILVALNGANAVDFKGSGGAALTDSYRVNEMSAVAIGSGGVAAAAVALQLQAGPNTVYANIPVGYTHRSDCIYTVPANKMLYLRRLNYGAAAANVANPQTARIQLKATMEESSHFVTNGIWHIISEVLITDNSQLIQLEIPLSIAAGADVKCSGIGLTGFIGPGAVTLRGWLETV